ncbi:hypothetical protein TeGR_g504 [Tetraparma gracilis]|uniref:Uncharacterized protein n=1 Tax=Tetraparma gracilis TaxID=2962635 RepID=A0ABQ6MBZ5_9STRA|nr:hypothetical protein TeGR_g504 [Tetraparma gracilis]
MFSTPTPASDVPDAAAPPPAAAAPDAAAPKFVMRKRKPAVVPSADSSGDAADSSAVAAGPTEIVPEGTVYTIPKTFEANAGHMIDVLVNNKGAVTKHTIITSNEWQAALEKLAGKSTTPEDLAKYS